MTLALTAPSRRVSWRALALIVIGNLIPIAGVRWFGWDAVQILLFYWVETLIIGLLTVPRILTARGDASTNKDRVSLAAFFTVHYGFFWIGHGVFAWSLAEALARADGGPTDILSRTFGAGGFRLAILAIVIVQIVMFVRDWRRSGLWRTARPGVEMFRPYGRVIIMHLTVLVGAWSLLELGAPASTVLLLCVGKMLLELATEVVGALLRKPPVSLAAPTG